MIVVAWETNDQYMWHAPLAKLHHQNRTSRGYVFLIQFRLVYGLIRQVLSSYGSTTSTMIVVSWETNDQYMWHVPMPNSTIRIVQDVGMCLSFPINIGIDGVLLPSA